MHRKIKRTAVLVGLSPENRCVYSELLSLDEYWDGTHVWDDSKRVKKLRLKRLRGLLFDEKGHLLQEFESTFSMRHGTFQKGWARHADGTYQEN